MKKPSGRDAHLAEQKLAVNSTARARKSHKRLFVLNFVSVRKGSIKAAALENTSEIY